MSPRRSAAVFAAIVLLGACSSGAAVPSTASTVLAPTSAPGTTSRPEPTTIATTTPDTTIDGRATITGERPCGALTTPPPTYDHVVWIWMENHNATQVIGRPEAPFVSALAAKCATATDYRSVGKPSLPNYIGATSGDTWGISDDSGPASHPLTVDNLFRQVRSAGGTAVSYQESMPANCTTGGPGPYAVKHNPAAYYVGGNDRAACATDDVPFSPNFLEAISGGTLPTFAFVTPDLCNDTHDCPVDRGDIWLTGVLTALLSTPTYQAGRTAIFLVWDEDAPMPFVAVAPSVRPGTVITRTVDHYSLLRTTEEMLGITTFLGKAAAAPSMRADLRA